jgi:two-component system sensor histidine kinase/response regulator
VPERLVGDSGRLRQVLVNLVGNAVKFTSEGEICVRVERDPDGDGAAAAVPLHVVVSDTGIGVVPEKQELIFDAFRQAEPGTIRKYGGTGLGLAIALELTRLLGGRIWVVSPGTHGVGSEFHFTAVLEQAEAPKELEAEPSEDSLPSTCLLVGMSGAPFDVTRRMLKSLLGQIAEIAIPADVSEPVSVPAADASGVVVLEVPAAYDVRKRMFDFLEGVRDCASRIVAISPVGLPPTEKERLAALSNHIVLKPIRPDALRDALQMLSDSDRPLASAPRSETAAPKRMRILIAEDDELSQWVLASICRNRGHDVALVSNGADAIRQVEKRDFDALLLDIQMPDCDGYDVAQQIRRAERGCRTAVRLPIIALSAHVGVEVRERCAASGMDGYLPKPVRARELFSRLEGILVRDDAMSQPAMGGAASDPLDWGQLEAFVGGDAAVRQNVLRSAVKLLGPALAAMETALQTMDFATVQNEAHRLKGMAGNIGARDLSDVAATLEQSASRQDLGGGRARLVELRSECDRLARFIESQAVS